MSDSAHLPSIPDFPAIVHPEFLFVLDTFRWDDFEAEHLLALLGGKDVVNARRIVFGHEILRKFAIETRGINLLWTTR